MTATGGTLHRATKHQTVVNGTFIGANNAANKRRPLESAVADRQSGDVAVGSQIAEHASENAALDVDATDAVAIAVESAVETSITVIETCPTDASVVVGRTVVC